MKDEKEQKQPRRQSCYSSGRHCPSPTQQRWAERVINER